MKLLQTIPLNKTTNVFLLQSTQQFWLSSSIQALSHFLRQIMIKSWVIHCQYLLDIVPRWLRVPLQPVAKISPMPRSGWSGCRAVLNWLNPLMRGLSLWFDKPRDFFRRCFLFSGSPLTHGSHELIIWMKN